MAKQKTKAPADRKLTVLITGANKGIGYETARQLAPAGWQVVLGARRAEAGREAVVSLSKDGDSVSPPRAGSQRAARKIDRFKS